MPASSETGIFSSVPGSLGLPYKPFRTKARISLLCVVVHLLLEVAADEHDGKREAKIERSEQQETAEEIIVRSADLAHGLSKFDNCDHRKQRRIFYDARKLSGECWKNTRDHLRQFDRDRALYA